MTFQNICGRIWIPLSYANQDHHAENAEYAKDKFQYNESIGGYVCPAGALLLPVKPRANRSEARKDYINYANPDACRNCAHKDKCKKGKYRTIQDKPNEQYARIVDRRTKEKMELYKKRQQLVEHPFGTVKRTLGFTYFLTRGTESVRAESLMHFLIYNMKRAINTVGTQGLRAELQG